MIVTSQGELFSVGKPFLVLCLSTLFFSFGRSMMSFGLGIWILRHTPGLLPFTGFSVVIILPQLVLTPIAGFVVDKYGVKWPFIIGTLFQLVVSFILALLLFFNLLRPWHLFCLSSAVSATGPFVGLAAQITQISLVPKENFQRTSAMINVTQQLLALTCPILAGAIMGFSSLLSLAAIELVTSCAGMAMMFWVLGYVKTPRAGLGQKETSARREMPPIRATICYFQKNKMMMVLLIYLMIQGFFLGVVGPLVGPIILAAFGSYTLGLVVMVGGLGGLLGATLLTIRPQNNHTMRMLMACDAAIAVCLIICGTLQGSIWLYFGCVFVGGLALSIGGTVGSALWMRKVPYEMQGKVMSSCRTLSILINCTSLLLCGTINDRLDRLPLKGMHPNNILGKAVTMSDRYHGLPLIFIFIGTTILAVSIAGMVNSRLMSLDQTVPDAV